MQGLLDDTTDTLDVVSPVDLAAPLNRGLHNWHLVLPHAMGGSTWRNLVRPRHALAGQQPGHATLSVTTPRSATLGWGATARHGGWGELRFDGVALGTIPSSPLYDFVDSTFTVSCWVRAGVAAQAFLVCRRTVAGTGGEWMLRLDSGGTATARLMNAAAGIIVQRTSVTATLLDGGWHHILAVFTTDTTSNAANEIALYVNGVLDQGARTGSVGLFPAAPTATNVTLGGYVGTTPLTGAMDDVRITRRLLAATEVQALYQASRLGYRRELRRLHGLSWAEDLSLGMLQHLLQHHGG